ncbi:putative ribonuclease H-like domain-containing protein [Tanacetum coccineum]
MDLKWQLALLSMRARKFYQRTGKKITINESDTAGYDKSKKREVTTKIGTYGILRLGNSNEVKKTSDTPLVEELVSEKEKQIVFPKQQDKTTRKLVNTAKAKVVNTARPKAVNTARPNSVVVNTVRANQANAGHSTKNVVLGLLPLEGVEEETVSVKVTLKMGKLDFQDVFFVKELQFNLFSVSQMCDKKNCVLFTDTACFILSLGFKLPDESQILLNIPRKNNMYSVDMKNIVPKESLTCLVAKATLDESMLWHRKLGHVNFKTINKLVKDNLVKGFFLGKGLPRFTWVFFLASKDETSGIFKNFITEIENLVDKKVKIIRCDNGTKFKNRVMNEFCKQKGIKKEYSVAKTPQQNGVAERRNRTLIEANRVIIVKPHNKTPYELFRGRTPALSFMRPFGCHVSILNTLDHLGKFDGKSDDGFFVRYSLTSKAFRGGKRHGPIVACLEVSIGEGTTSKETETSQDYIVMPLWKDSSLFDSPSMNVSHDEPEPSCDAEKKDDEGVSKGSGVDDQERPESSTPNINTAGPSINTASAYLRTGSLHINIVSPTVLTTRSNRPQSVSDIFSLRDNVTPEATNADLFGDETKIDMSNLNASYHVPTTPNTRIHKDHSLDHVFGDIQSGVQTRGMTKTANEQGFLSVAYERKPHKDLHYNASNIIKMHLI